MLFQNVDSSSTFVQHHDFGNLILLKKQFYLYAFFLIHSKDRFLCNMLHETAIAYGYIENHFYVLMRR